MPSDSPLLPSPRELLGPEISPRLEQLTPPGQKIKLAGGRDQERLRVSGPKEHLPPARRVNPLGDNRPGTRTADRVGPGHDPSALPAPTPAPRPCPPPTLGWGGTDSLSLGTDFETTFPFFGHGQPLVLPSPNLQPPLFMEAQGQPLQIVTFR